MRTNITIVGVGNRTAGISRKTNQAYDFTPIAFTFSDGRIAGERACTVNVSADVLGNIQPKVGDTYDAVLHQSNFQIYLDAILQ